MPISKTHTKNQFAKEPEGLGQFRDHRWKGHDEENSDLPSIFLWSFFEILIFKTSENTAPTKIYTAYLDSPRQELSNGGLGIVLCNPYSFFQG